MDHSQNILSVLDLETLYRPGNPTCMARAVCGGDLNKVKELLASGGAHPNYADHRGWTPLHLAASHRQYEIAKEILKDDRTNPDAITHEGETALNIAIQYNAQTELVQLLDQHVNNKVYVTLLTNACARCTPDIVEYLLSVTQLNLDQPVGFLPPPLFVALERGSYQLTELLLRAGANVNLRFPSCERPLTFAILKDCDKTIVDLLISWGAEVNVPGTLSPLVIAIERNRLDIAVGLVQQGAEINSVHNKITALTLAVQAGKLNLVKKLMSESSSRDMESTCDEQALPIGLLCTAIGTEDNEMFSMVMNHNFSLPILESPVSIRFRREMLSLQYDHIGPLAFLLKEKLYGHDAIYIMAYMITIGVSPEPKGLSHFPPLVAALVSRGPFSSKKTPGDARTQEFAIDVLLRARVNVDYKTSFLPDALLAAVGTKNCLAVSKLLPYSRYTPCDIARLCLLNKKEFMLTYILERMISKDDFSSLRRHCEGADEDEVLSQFTFNVPRLTVIARQRVRQCLRETNTTAEFLKVINDLQVPQTLRDYLRFM